MRWAVAGVLASGVVACGARGTARLPADTRGVRLADPAAATEYSTRTERIELPFELDRAGLSATALVIDFLRLAEARGARYVSDLAVAIHFRHEGVALECVSTLVVGDRAAPAAAAAAARATTPVADDIYATTIRPWLPEQVKAWVDDRDLVCKKVPVATVVPRYASRHDASLGHYYAPGELPAQNDVWIEYKDDCHLETRHRLVERYAHFVATRISPVDVARVRAEFADDQVTERPPECHELRAGQHPAHRVMGDLHYVGSSGRASQLPDVLAH